MKKWNIAKPNQQTVELLAEQSGISKLLAVLLVNRNIQTVASVREELAPHLDLLHDPVLFPQMDLAVKRINQAITRKQRILIYGDYDADGLTGTALLYSCLRKYTNKVFYYIPHRIEEGYGLHVEAIEQAERDKINLLITVDCGITAIKEAELIQQLNLDLIITDHHAANEQLPKAIAVLHTKSPDTPEPFRELAGVGVAYKFAQAISASVENRDTAKIELANELDLVAIGTICDVVPLVGENRLLTKFGLQQLIRTQRPGLQALMTISGLGYRKIESQQVAFSLGPRLNAAGRMGHADTALRLLLTDNSEQATGLARELDDLNQARRQLESEILSSAEEKIGAEADLLRNRAIVVANKSWHQGVLGVVAGRLAEKYQRPVAMLGFDGEFWSGSIRGVNGFDLMPTLRQCDTLANYGGHWKAAGISIDEANLPLFRKQFYAVVNRQMVEFELTPSLDIDAEVKVAELSFSFLKEELPRLEPFGAGNPEPIFLIRQLTLVAEPKLLKEKHLKLSFRTPENISCTGMFYNWINQENTFDSITYGEEYDIVFTPRLNRYQGTESFELHIKDIRSANAGNLKSRN